MNVELSKVEVRFSETEGRALYATGDFRQGETILNLPTDTMAGPDMFSIEVLPGIHLDCTRHPIGATNHSCNPNAAIRGMNLIAWNCIKAGEQITIDYKRTEQKLAAPFDCFCGTKFCKGRIE